MALNLDWLFGKKIPPKSMCKDSELEKSSDIKDPVLTKINSDLDKLRTDETVPKLDWVVRDNDPNHLTLQDLNAKDAQVVEAQPQEKGQWRILSIEPALDSDLLITFGDNTGPCHDPSLPAWIGPQFLAQSGHTFYTYPEFKKIELRDENRYRGMKETFLLKQKYLKCPALTMAIQARKSDVKCVYCHSLVNDKAQVCLPCGTFLCLACVPTTPKCPGCNK